jgi:hypothetical protein
MSTKKAKKLRQLRWPKTKELSARPQPCDPYAGFRSRRKRIPPLLDTAAMGRPWMG